jgi:uncharacterized membrane protein YphA (DoxX/SURF4 family)
MINLFSQLVPAGQSRMRRYLELLFQIVISVVFLVAGLQKATDWHSFAAAISQYKVVSALGVAIASLYIPWLELMIGVCLLLRFAVAGALVWASALLSLFAIVQVATLWRGLRISCGCFGPAGDELVGPWSVTRTISVLVCVVAYAILRQHQRRSDSSGRESP